MPTQKQRREAARRHLERQVQRRAEREAARKKLTLIVSVLGTLAIIAVVIGLVVGIGGSDKGDSTASGASGSTTDSASASASDSASASASAGATPSTSYSPAQGAPVTFQDVTVVGAKDLTGYPTVTSTATSDPTQLEYKDLVVGTGKAATPESNVTVQYVGVLYKGGTEPFDSSWSRGQTAQFPLGPGNVIDGFTQGIGGGSGTPAMKVGGRRLIIMPASLGYGSSSPSSAIPANSPLVFVVDLKSVDG